MEKAYYLILLLSECFFVFVWKIMITGKQMDENDWNGPIFNKKI